VWTVISGVVAVLGLVVSLIIIVGTGPDSDRVSGVASRGQTASQNAQVKAPPVPGSGPTRAMENPTGIGSVLAGTWKGEYRCAQGLTGLTLVFFVVDDVNLRATFEFYPVPSNPTVPRGSFALKGTYYSTGFSLEPDYWIHQPPGYGMLALSFSVTVTEPPRISGDLPEGCNRLEVVRVSDESHPPPI
jgi:hypothetical protein